MLININRIFLNVLGVILLLFMLYVMSLNFDLYPQQIEYNETKEFLSNLSYNKGDFPPSCLVNVDNLSYCSFKNLLIYPNYLDISSNFNCSLYVNTTYFAPGEGGTEGPQPYNSTHNMIGCIYSLSPYTTYCNESNSYTFLFEFNATPLPQPQDTNITILNNLSYYDGTTYLTCNISYNYTFMPSPLPSLTQTYQPLNGTRTHKSNIIYTYPEDYFFIILNASNIRDNEHTGKLKYSWVN